MLRSFTAVIFVISVLGRGPIVAGQQDKEGSVLQIDPLLIAQASEVWKLIGAEHNPVWPGWNAQDSPILFYLPGRQDVLINHPSPPQGFVPYDGPIGFPVGQILVRDGDTLIKFDGQNTSLDIEGHETLVVADTLSNLKNTVVSLISSPAPVREKVDNLQYSYLHSDPYATMGLIAHEAFHVFQRSAAEGKSGNELALTRYPALDVENNVGFALEGTWLAAALRAGTDDQRRAAAVKWLAAREWRRRNLATEAIAYEDGTEFNEGLAKYVEYRLLQVLEGREPGPEMKWVRGFRGYVDLSPDRDRLIDMMVRHMHGEVNVNNDPYGASPLRMRFYFSGMAIAALLDTFGVSWHDAILKPDTTLTSLARTAIAARPEELDAAREALAASADYQTLQTEKTKLREKGQAWIQSELDSINSGPNTALVVDYSRLKNPEVAMSFTPFGIVAVDAERTIFRLIPVTAKLRDQTRFEQTSAAPVLQDRDARRFVFQLRERVSREKLLECLKRDELPEGPSEVEEVLLPGVKLWLGKVEVQWGEDRIVFTLCQ